MTDEPCPLCGYAAGHSATCANLPSNRSAATAASGKANPRWQGGGPVKTPARVPGGPAAASSGPKTTQGPFVPFRYPPNTTCTARWDGKQWIGTLIVMVGGDGQVFQTNASSWQGLGSHLAKMYQRFLKEKDNAAPAP